MLDEFAQQCVEDGVSEVKVSVQSKFKGSGPEATLKYRPVYIASGNESRYTGRWTGQNWSAEFVDYPDFEDIRAAAYDSWERFLQDREYLEEEYGLDTTADPTV